MSQFSGRMTDSHGLRRHEVNGKLVPDSPHVVVGTAMPSRGSGVRNKGVKRIRQEIKREQAEERQSAYDAQRVEAERQVADGVARASSE